MPEEKKQDLKISVTNFGPIKNGTVEIRPCTVLLGPNNAGKSYFAMLLHSLLQFTLPAAIPEIDFSSIIEEYGQIQKSIENLKEGEQYELPDDMIEQMDHHVLDAMFRDVLEQELTRSFAANPDELVRSGCDRFSLEIGFDSQAICLELIKSERMKTLGNPLVKHKIIVEDTAEVKYIHNNYDGKDFIQEFNYDRSDASSSNFRVMLSHALTTIYKNWQRNLRDRISFHSYYLPAARTGILLAGKSLLSDIVKKTAFAGSERFDIPKFSGVLSDLISSLIDLPSQEGPFFKLAGEFEQEIIKGRITIERVSPISYPDIKFFFLAEEIPLYRSSSTVSELAPLFLYLKYRIKPGDLLIIEEPEAHLHPENQRIIAKYLVRLIRRGVRLVITTHSDYLLDQLSSFLLLSRVKDGKKIETLNYDKNDYLVKSEIGVYVFHRELQGEGYTIHEVEVNEEDGISQEEFVKVCEALYDESIKIQENIQD